MTAHLSVVDGGVVVVSLVLMFSISGLLSYKKYLQNRKRDLLQQQQQQQQQQQGHEQQRDGSSSTTSAADQVASSYFLSGRSMNAWAVGLSLFASNIGSEHFIGLAGAGASGGMAVGFFEWSSAFLLILLGYVFAPAFRDSNVFTTPQWLSLRFASPVRSFLACLSILMYILTKVSGSIYAGSLLLEAAAGWGLWTSVSVITIVTGFYTAFGGLSAVIYADSVQSIIFISAGITAAVYSLYLVGGWSGLQHELRHDDGMFHMWKPLSDPDYPITGLMIGQPIVSMWYWCFDQVMVQRVLAAKSLVATRQSTVLASWLKILPVFMLVIPGMCARVLFPKEIAKDSNKAFVLLVVEALPQGLRGMMIAAILAALMSSLSSIFNSTSTLVAVDIVKPYHTAWKRWRKKRKVQSRAGGNDGDGAYKSFDDDDGDQHDDGVAGGAGDATGDGGGGGDCVETVVSDVEDGNSKSGGGVISVGSDGGDDDEPMTPVVDEYGDDGVTDGDSDADDGGGTGEDGAFLVWVGRLSVLFMVGCSLAWIPVVHAAANGRLFLFIQGIQSYLAPPVTCIFLFGLLWKRANARGAAAGLLVGSVIGLARLGGDAITLMNPIIDNGSGNIGGGGGGRKDEEGSILSTFFFTVNFMHFAALSFLMCSITVTVVSLMTRAPSTKQQALCIRWARLKSCCRVPEDDSDGGGDGNGHDTRDEDHLSAINNNGVDEVEEIEMMGVAFVVLDSDQDDGDGDGDGDGSGDGDGDGGDGHGDDRGGSSGDVERNDDGERERGNVWADLPNVDGGVDRRWNLSNRLTNVSAVSVLVVISSLFFHFR